MSEYTEFYEPEDLGISVRVFTWDFYIPEIGTPGLFAIVQPSRRVTDYTYDTKIPEVIKIVGKSKLGIPFSQGVRSFRAVEIISEAQEGNREGLMLSELLSGKDPTIEDACKWEKVPVQKIFFELDAEEGERTKDTKRIISIDPVTRLVEELHLDNGEIDQVGTLGIDPDMHVCFGYSLPLPIIEEGLLHSLAYMFNEDDTTCLQRIVLLTYIPEKKTDNTSYTSPFGPDYPQSFFYSQNY